MPEITPYRLTAAIEFAAKAFQRQNKAAEDLATAKASLTVAKEVECLQRCLTAYQRAGDDLDRADLRYGAMRELLETLTGMSIEALLDIEVSGSTPS